LASAQISGAVDVGPHPMPSASSRVCSKASTLLDLLGDLAAAGAEAGDAREEDEVADD